MFNFRRIPIWVLNKYTVCPRSSDPLYVVTYYIKWVTTSWTDSTSVKGLFTDFTWGMHGTVSLWPLRSI